jgi:serine/threonine protein kinase
MLKGSHPFIVPLYFTFQDEKSLYYGMELLRGGSLHAYIKKMKGFSEEIAKFFTAQIVMALRYLH